MRSELRHSQGILMRPELRHSQGMTLTELMVSMSVLVVVIGWVMVAFTDQHHSQLNHERVIEAQHEGRLITDLMISDLRMAGFMVPARAGVGSVDGGVNAPDVICMSDPSVMDATKVDDANQRFSGAQPTGAVNGVDSTVSIGAGDVDVDNDGTVDFVLGSGIIIADGDNVHCAVITAPNPVIGATTDITFSPATPAGFSAAGAGAVVVPAVHYAVNANDLLRNGTVLTSNVEDIQIEYWVDANADSVMDPAEFPVHDLNGQTLSDLRLARVSVTSRTDIPDLDMPGRGFPAVANRVAGAADDFKRRRQIAETLLRNVR